MTEDGFFKTGDIGKVDSNGYEYSASLLTSLYYITDRLKELIKYKG